MRELLPTPEQMVAENGQPYFGIFRTPFKVVNPLDADIHNNNRLTPRWFRNFRLKEWQHFGIVHDEFYLGFVVFNAKFMGVSFTYLYDRRSGKLIEYEHKTPGKPPILSENLWRGRSHFAVPGYRIDIENCLEEGYHEALLDIAGTDQQPALKASLRMTEDLDHVQPMVAVLPAGPKRPFYTHKVSLPAAGTVRLGETLWELTPDRHAALFDVQKTYYPYNFFWLWATFTGWDTGGSRIAVNLSRNAVTDHEELNQNCMWVDGKMSLFGRVHFEYNPHAILTPWRMTTSDGRLNLNFTPEGERKQDINALIIKSWFHQPFGNYSGVLIDDDGKRHEIKEAFGVAEEHLMRS